MNVGSLLIPHCQAPEAAQPCDRPLDDPAVTPELLRRLDTLASDAGHDVTQMAGQAQGRIVVALVGMQFFGSPTQSAARARVGGAASSMAVNIFES